MKFAIGTSHFESLHFEMFRKKQLEIAFPFLKQYDFACLMGDFNFDNVFEEKRIDKDFLDVWKIFNDLEKNPGFTMPETQSK